MSLPVFRAAGAQAGSATTATIPVPAPAGLTVGDLEIMIAEGGASSGDTLTLVTPGGSAWTQMTGSPVTGANSGSNATVLAIWWRINQAGDSNPSLKTSTNHFSAARLAYQAGTFDPISPFEVVTPSFEAVNDTSFSFTPGVSTTGPERLVLCVSTTSNAGAAGQIPVCTNVNLSSLVSRVNYSNNLSNGGGFGATEGALVSPGSIGTFACTYTVAGQKAYMAFAIKPVAALGPAGLKTVLGIPKGSIKTIRGLPIGQVKTWIGLP